MVTIVPDFNNALLEDVYRAQIENKEELFDSDFISSKAEFVFLLDRSGSMSGI